MCSVYIVAVLGTAGTNVPPLSYTRSALVEAVMPAGDEMRAVLPDAGRVVRFR